MTGGCDFRLMPPGSLVKSRRHPRGSSAARGRTAAEWLRGLSEVSVLWLGLRVSVVDVGRRCSAAWRCVDGVRRIASAVPAGAAREACGIGRHTRGDGPSMRGKRCGVVGGHAFGVWRAGLKMGLPPASCITALPAAPREGCGRLLSFLEHCMRPDLSCWGLEGGQCAASRSSRVGTCMRGLVAAPAQHANATLHAATGKVVW